MRIQFGRNTTDHHCSSIRLNGESIDPVKRLSSWSNPSSSCSFFLYSSQRLIPTISGLLVILGCLGLLGCPQESSPLKGDNQRLTKQVAKQESLITSLQEGNKIMQQQINLLNQEARETKVEFERELKESKEQLTNTIQKTQTGRGTVTSTRNGKPKTHQRRQLAENSARANAEWSKDSEE